MSKKITSYNRLPHDIDMIYPNLLKYYKLNERNDLIITTDGYAINPFVLDDLIRKINLKIPVTKRIIRFSIEGEPHVENIFFDSKRVIYIIDGTNLQLSGEIIFKQGNDIVKEKLNEMTKYYLITNNTREEMFSYESYRWNKCIITINF